MQKPELATRPKAFWTRFKSCNFSERLAIVSVLLLLAFYTVFFIHEVEPMPLLNFAIIASGIASGVAMCLSTIALGLEAVRGQLLYFRTYRWLLGLFAISFVAMLLSCLLNALK